MSKIEEGSVKVKAKSALDIKNKYCQSCLRREPKYCQICEGFDQWQAFPPAQKFELRELSHGDVDWTKVSGWRAQK